MASHIDKKTLVLIERSAVALVVIGVLAIYLHVGPPGAQLRETTPTIEAYTIDRVSSQGLPTLAEPKSDADRHLVNYISYDRDLAYMLRNVESAEDAMQIVPDLETAVMEMNSVAKDFANQARKDRRDALAKYATELRESKRSFALQINHLRRRPRAAQTIEPIVTSRPTLED